MAWILLKSLDTNNHKFYKIINSNNVLQSLKTIRLNSVVRYKSENGKIVNGIIICISENLFFIEKKLEDLLEFYWNIINKEEIKETKNIHDIEIWYLIQYNKKSDDVIYAVVNRNELFWPTVSVNHKRNNHNVFLNDNNEMRSATVLQTSNDETKLLKKLQNLKKIYLTKINQLKNSKNESLSKITGNITTNEWFLIQCSGDVDNIMYTIINSNEIIWKKENYFNESIAYFQNYSTIYQGVIIMRSFNKNEIDNILNILKNECLQTKTTIQDLKLEEIDDKSLINCNEKQFNEADKTIQTSFLSNDNVNRTHHENNNVHDNDIRTRFQEQILKELEIKESNIYNDINSLNYALQCAEIINFQMEKKLMQLDDYLCLNF